MSVSPGCPRCAKEKGYHSFEYVGQTLTEEGIYYSRISYGKETALTDETLKYLIFHMDEASKKNSWILVFDCRGMEKMTTPTIQILQKLSVLIQERYKNVLRHIYILYPDWKMNIILTMVKLFSTPEMNKRTTVCETPLEFFKFGMNHSEIKNLLS